MPTLPYRFGDWTPPPGLAAIDGTSITWLANMGDDGIALLLSQFQNKPRIVAFLRSLLAGVQDLSDAIYQVLIGIWLDSAEGVQLDEIGVILDTPRRGWTDPAYRAILRAQIIVYRSLGGWPDFAAIMAALGVTLALTSIAEPGIAAARATLGELITTPISPADIFRMLVAAKPASVRFTVTYPTAPIASSFAFCDTTPTSSPSTAFGDAIAGGIGGRWAGLLASTGVA